MRPTDSNPHKPDPQTVDELPRRAHVFIDESKSRGYLMAAAFVHPKHLQSLRRALRQLRPRGRRSVHFNGARDELRHAVLDVLTAHEVTAMVVLSTGRRGLQQREMCVRKLAQCCAAAEAGVVVLDLDESVVSKDRRWLYEELHKSETRYDHLHRHEEPLLWAADAVAWAWQRAGSWRDRVRPLVTRLHEVS
ncbi:hypothetical protein GCM10010413_45830 [Promicromonospora sukumoe]|uniref:Thiamine phosphate synthase YjbQ (UPF0047 family) n=1 Tax=Promicromonospora sukumoe TaxID=88382 RepID=A0A7W3PG15_9MICO|nr:DUF3800 domain-containing protein [Promicromonospora sukumoe]MBA8810149.1 thiamine phosphate synthase YjbQ (UPF0047 family) [Promicromonospora sukumoe]